jgi:hypothetical protein
VEKSHIQVVKEKVACVKFKVSLQEGIVFGTFWQALLSVIVLCHVDLQP